MTSPVLCASPSPAPFCSIFGSPNRLDLWLDLCLKLLFDCQNPLKVTNGVAVDIYLKFVVILFDFGRSVTLLSPKKHARNTPICGHTFSQHRLSTRMRANANAMPAKDACSTSRILNVSSPKKMAAQSASIIQIYAESSPSRSLGSIVKLYMCYAHSAFEQII